MDLLLEYMVGVGRRTDVLPIDYLNAFSLRFAFLKTGRNRGRL